MRYQSFTRGDSVGFVDGDARWMGIDSTRDRDKVASGRLYIGENTRLRTGTIKQRAGTQIPQDFNPTSGFGNTLVGSGVFRDPNGDEALLIAPASSTFVYALRFGKDPVQIDYGVTTPPTGDNGTGQVEFVQCYDSVQLLRIPVQGAQNLIWNGVYDQTSDTNKWQITTLPSNGLTLIPAMWHGEPFGDRVAFYQAYFPAAPNRDSWIMSDLYLSTSYDPVYQAIRTNAAESDTIVRIMQYFKGSLIVFKNNSIHMGSDLGTYPFQLGQRMLTGGLGLVGNHTPVSVGGDILFPSQPNGIYRLSEVINDQIVTLPLPISEPIQRVIDQINWPYTEIWGTSAVLDNYAFFGVCLGPTATRPNAILVYNTQTREWESAPDTWADPNFAFNRLHVINFGGNHRLVAVDYDAAVVYLLYEGISDNLITGTFPVPFKAETRGYVGDDPLAFKKYGRASLSFATWDPSITVTALTDGVNEEFVLTDNPITKSNAEYYTHGAAPFDPNTSDVNAPYREDYSISDFDTFACEDFEAFSVGPITLIPATLFETVGDMQQATERFMVRQLGRWCALRIENGNGHLEVQGASMEGQTAVSTVKTAA